MNIIISKLYSSLIQNEVYVEIDCDSFGDFYYFQTKFDGSIQSDNQYGFTGKCYPGPINEFQEQLKVFYRKLNLDETSCFNGPLTMKISINRWKIVQKQAFIQMNDVNHIKTLPLNDYTESNLDRYWLNNSSLITFIENVLIKHKKSGLCLSTNDLDYIEKSIKVYKWKEDDMINSSIIRLVNCSNNPSVFSIDEKGLIYLKDDKYKCISKWPSKRLALNQTNAENIVPLIISRACKTFFKILSNMFIDPVSHSCIYPDYLINKYNSEMGIQHACILNNNCSENAEFITITTTDSKANIPFKVPLIVETRKSDYSTFVDLLVPLNSIKIDDFDMEKFKESNSLESNDVLVILFDRLSNIQFDLNMPQTKNILVDLMKGVIFRNFIQNDSLNVKERFFDLLYGKEILDLTNYTENIFHLYKKSGYKTFLSVDCPNLSEDVNGLLAYVNYSDTIVWSKMKQIPLTGNQPFCVGSIPRHDISIDLLYEFWKTYDKSAKFAVLNFIKTSELNKNYASAIDTKLATFLIDLFQYDNLPRNQPPIIILAGLRPQILSENEGRKAIDYHNRATSLVVSIPNSLKKKRHNLFANRNKIITTVDLKKVITSIAESSDDNPYNTLKNGYDFVASMIPDRSCTDLNIKNEHCPCY